MPDKIGQTVANIKGDAAIDHQIDENEAPPSPEEQGESSSSGSATAPPADDDTAQMVKDVIGNEPEPGKPFSLAEEVAKDEADRRGLTED